MSTMPATTMAVVARGLSEVAVISVSRFSPETDLIRASNSPACSALWSCRTKRAAAVLVDEHPGHGDIGQVGGAARAEIAQGGIVDPHEAAFSSIEITTSGIGVALGTGARSWRGSAPSAFLGGALRLGSRATRSAAQPVGMDHDEAERDVVSECRG